MKPKYISISLSFFLLLTSQLFSQIELIHNGDFENNTFSGNLTLCTTGTLSDWTVITNSIDGIHDSWSSNNNWPDGSGWFIDLVGSCSNISSPSIIKSNSFDLDAKSNYALAFQYGSELALVNAKVSLKTSLGNTLETWVITSQSVNDWFNFNENYFSQDNQLGCYLEFEGELPSFQTGGMGIDNISLVQGNSQVSITENEIDPELLLYPNPGSGTFFVDLGNYTGNVEFSITDLYGREIQSPVHNYNQLFKFEITEPAGIYLLMIKFGDQHVAMRIQKY